MTTWGNIGVAQLRPFLPVVSVGQTSKPAGTLLTHIDSMQARLSTTGSHGSESKKYVTYLTE
jgi:hypothetical protein